MNIYHDGKQHRTEYVAPPMPTAVVLGRAEDHLSYNLEAFIERFDQWHGSRCR